MIIIDKKGKFTEFIRQWLVGGCTKPTTLSGDCCLLPIIKAKIEQPKNAVQAKRHPIYNADQLLRTLVWLATKYPDLVQSDLPASQPLFAITGSTFQTISQQGHCTVCRL